MISGNMKKKYKDALLLYLYESLVLQICSICLIVGGINYLIFKCKFTYYISLVLEFIGLTTALCMYGFKVKTNILTLSPSVFNFIIPLLTFFFVDNVIIIIISVTVSCFIYMVIIIKDITFTNIKTIRDYYGNDSVFFWAIIVGHSYSIICWTFSYIFIFYNLYIIRINKKYVTKFLKELKEFNIIKYNKILKKKDDSKCFKIEILLKEVVEQCSKYFRYLPKSLEIFKRKELQLSSIHSSHSEGSSDKIKISGCLSDSSCSQDTKLTPQGELKFDERVSCGLLTILFIFPENETNKIEELKSVYKCVFNMNREEVKCDYNIISFVYNGMTRLIDYHKKIINVSALKYFLKKYLGY